MIRYVNKSRFNFSSPGTSPQARVISRSRFVKSSESRSPRFIEERLSAVGGQLPVGWTGARSLGTTSDRVKDRAGASTPVRSSAGQSTAPLVVPCLRNRRLVTLYQVVLPDPRGYVLM